jgi:iron complex outermembrane recepter protein
MGKMRSGLDLLKLGLALGVAAGSAAYAQEGQSGGVYEDDEIVVTAQLRQERLQDVPVSISALSGETLSDRGVVSLDQLTSLAPGVRISSYGNPNFVFIRGVGAGNNLATEQPIGTFIDGVYFGRDRAAKSQLFDLERVEILRGPQVTLFGKNTIGGAFNIVTRDPGEEFGGYAQTSYETELGSAGVEGAVNLPVSDSLRFRVGARYQEALDWVENEGYGEAAGAPEQLTGRVVMVAEPRPDLTIRLKAEGGSLRGGLDPFELIRTTPGFLAAVQAVDPSEDGELNRHATGPGVVPGFDQAYNDVDTQNYVGAVDWRFSDHVLTSVTGYVSYEVAASGDVDASALSLIKNDSEQEYTSFSQEFRIASPDDRRFEYIAGLYFADENYDVHKAVSINIAGHPTLDAVIPAVVPRLVTRNQFFAQSTETLSLFAQGSFHATDELSFTAGLRYVDTEKEVSRQDLFFSVFGETTPDAMYNAIFPGLGLGVVHFDSGISREEDSLSGLARVEYRPREGALYYLSYTRGEKAGGFDEDNARALPRANEFEPETVDSYQAGMKLDVWSGVLNVDLFYNEISDLQVASFDGVAAFQVTNAASAVSRGVDVEFRQRLSDRWGFALQGSYLDAYYESYEGAPGVYPAATQDLSGEPLAFAPRWTGNLSLFYDRPLPGGWLFTGQADYFYSSSYNATFNNDPALEQGDYGKLDLRLSVYHADSDLEVSLLARNVTDSTSISFGNPLPLAPLIGVNYFAYSDPPRTLALQIRKGF